MLLGAANAAARFNNCVRQPAPPLTGAPQMTGGRPSRRLALQSPSLGRSKDYKRTHDAKVQLSKNRQKTSLLSYSLETYI